MHANNQPDGVFTDENLKRLKEDVEDSYSDSITRNQMRALLSRLEAAEAVIDAQDGRCGHSWNDHDLGPCEVAAAMIHWRKRCGR